MTDDDGTAGFDYNAPEVFERNYAPAGFDRRHTFTLAYAFQLPFGGGDSRSLLNVLVRGWQLNGTLAAYPARRLRSPPATRRWISAAICRPRTSSAR